MYTFKQTCEILNMTEHTLRYYTDNGLLLHPKRDKNNRRIYDDEDLDWLRGAKYLRELGLSIQDIKEYHLYCSRNDEEASKKRHELLQKQKELALKSLQEIQKKCEYIQKKMDYVDFLIENHEIDQKSPHNKKYE